MKITIDTEDPQQVADLFASFANGATVQHITDLEAEMSEANYAGW